MWPLSFSVFHEQTEMKKKEKEEEPGERRSSNEVAVVGECGYDDGADEEEDSFSKINDVLQSK